MGVDLLDRLKALTPGHFAELLVRLGLDAAHFLPSNNEPGARAVQLLQFWRGQGRTDAELETALVNVAAGPTAPSYPHVVDASHAGSETTSRSPIVSPSPTSTASGSLTPSPVHSFQADVVIVTALKDEYDEARKVDEGAIGGEGWMLDTRIIGFEVAFRTYRGKEGQHMRVALTWAPRTRTTTTADIAGRLVDSLGARCVAMSGVCAGRRGKVEPGDVIIANLLYTYDTGSVRAEYNETGIRQDRFQADPNPYPLDEQWLHRAQAFTMPAHASWLNERNPTLTAQCDWVLAVLHRGNDPLAHPDIAKQCTDWDATITKLRAMNYLTRKSPPVVTKKGSAHIADLLYRNRNHLPEAPAWHIHVAPIATGNNVMRDPQLFERLSSSMRTVLGVDMESAAIASVAHARRLPWMVVKGVMDHADNDKDDLLKRFAARASAECLIAFLRKYLDLGTQHNAPSPAESTVSTVQSFVAASQPPAKGIDTKKPILQLPRIRRAAMLMSFLFGAIAILALFQRQRSGANSIDAADGMTDPPKQGLSPLNVFAPVLVADGGLGSSPQPHALLAYLGANLTSPPSPLVVESVHQRSVSPESVVFELGIRNSATVEQQAAAVGLHGEVPASFTSAHPCTAGSSPSFSEIWYLLKLDQTPSSAAGVLDIRFHATFSPPVGSVEPDSAVVVYRCLQGRQYTDWYIPLPTTAISANDIRVVRLSIPTERMYTLLRHGAGNNGSILQFYPVDQRRNPGRGAPASFPPSDVPAPSIVAP